MAWQNLKGRSEELLLGPANWIFGDNMTGKTTVLDALRLLFLGYHPKHDKTARGSFELASGAEMQVSGVILEQHGKDPGKTMTVGREWRSDGSSVRQKNFLPMGWPDVPVVLLDAQAYFGASDRGRTEMLFSVARVSGGRTAKELDDELERLLPEDKAKVSLNVKASPQDFVNEALGKVEEWRSGAAAVVRRMEGTLQGLTQLQVASEPKPVSPDAKRDLTQKRGELEAAQGQLKDAERAKALHEKTHTPEESAASENRAAVEDLTRQIDASVETIKKTRARWEKLLEGTGKKLFCKKCMANAEKVRDEQLEELGQAEANLFMQRKDKAGKQKSLDAQAKKVRDRLLKEDAEKIETLETKVAELRETVAGLEREVGRYDAEVNDRKRLAESRTERENAERDLKQLEAAKKWLLEVKEEMVRELFAPVLETARHFTRGIFRRELVFDQGTLGLWDGNETVGRFYPYRSFSGLEESVSFAALQAALGAHAPVKLVVMDELGTLGRDNKRRLVQNVLKAIEAGVIDQFIGVDVDDLTVRDLGLNLIERTA